MKFTSQPITVQGSDIKLVGIACHTNHATEKKKATAKIEPTMQQYCTLAPKPSDQQQRSNVYYVYAQDENDLNDEYIFFIGQEATASGDIPASFQTLTIPAQQYTKFPGPGVMPAVYVGTWKKTWQMMPAKLGQEKAYTADIHIFDDRAVDLKWAMLNTLVGI